MVDGLLSLPWWAHILVALALTHITIVSVTVYLHRCQAHRALDLHPIVSHFFRLWLWLTTGMSTKEWVAIHRKHHAKCETAEDPHSPHVAGIRKVLWQGAELYKAEAGNTDTLVQYGHGTPDDWAERTLYGRGNIWGISMLAVAYVLLFGVYGITMWAVQMIWIPFFAAGVINGLGHWRGYRNYETADGATNLTNIGILIGGEEMHNNHHAFPSSAKFSSKWWEFDIGWFYIRLMSVLGLARVKKVAPKPVILEHKQMVDMDTLKAVIVSRLHIMSDYAKYVSLPVLKQELEHADHAYRALLLQIRRVLVREESRIDAGSRNRLAHVLSRSEALATVYEFRSKLQEIWTRTHANQEKLLHALQDWCHQAEATGLKVLIDFSRGLKGYALLPA
jgi:stearoyl-CoA desaturase (Delta-9 desaturase)